MLTSRSPATANAGRHAEVIRPSLAPITAAGRSARRWAAPALLAAALALSLLPAADASACSCVEPGPPGVEAEHADAVFSGQVIQIEEVTVERTGNRLQRRGVTFRLADVWKGVAEGDRLTITTGFNDGDCGYAFEKGKKYIVYAYGDDPADLSTGICSRTRPLAEADEDVEALGSPQRSAAEKAEKKAGDGDG